MKKIKKVLAAVLASAMVMCSVPVQAGQFKQNSKGTYYKYDNGTYADGLAEIDGDLYLFKNRYLYTGWIFDENGYPERYFNPFADGKAAKGWVTESAGKMRYFNKKTGICIKGWNKTDGKYRYFYKPTALMAMGWVHNGEGYRYFSKKNGVMAVGWVKNEKGEYRYFDKNNGIMYTGWVATGSGKYYFNPSNGVCFMNRTAAIDGKLYQFNSKGIATDVTGF